jgi:lactoylglutathione lyase
MFKHIQTVGVYVTDQQAAVDFYTEKLGFEIRDDVEADEGARWIEVAPPGAQTTICLTPSSFSTHDDSKVGVYTGMSWAVDDIHEVHKTLSERGVHFKNEPQQMPYGKWFASFVDQDGNEYFVHADV